MDVILVLQANGEWAKLAVVDNGDGTVSLATTTDTPNNDLLFGQANGENVRLATVLAGGVDTLAVALPPENANNWRLSYEKLLESFGPLPSVVLNGTSKYYAASDADVGSRIRCASGAGLFIDFAGLSRNNGFILVDVLATTTFACGVLGEQWRGAGTNKITAAAGIYLVYRSQGDYVCVSLPALTTPSVAAWPIPAWMFGGFGQSYRAREDDSGNRGFTKGRELAGLSATRFCQFVRGMPVGASRVTKGTASGGYLWDQDTGLPAANYTTALNAAIAGQVAFPIASGYPAMMDIPWQHGANEFDGFAAAGPVTPAILTASYQAAAAKFRVDLGAAIGADLSGLRFWISPWCGFDDDDVGPAGYAQRRAQLSACDNVINLRGPDYYDITRIDGIHQSPSGMSLHALRLALYHARFVEGANVFLGSSIFDIDGNARGLRKIAPGQFRVYMLRYGGLSATGLNVAPITQPDNPLGFAVHTSSDFFGTPLFPARFEWGTDGSYTTLDLFTRDDTDDPYLAYPYGSMEQASVEQERIVRTLDRALSVTWPLATFHPTVGIPD